MTPSSLAVGKSRNQCISMSFGSCVSCWYMGTTKKHVTSRFRKSLGPNKTDTRGWEFLSSPIQIEKNNRYIYIYIYISTWILRSSENHWFSLENWSQVLSPPDYFLWAIVSAPDSLVFRFYITNTSFSTVVCQIRLKTHVRRSIFVTGSMVDFQHRKETGRVALITFHKRTCHKSSIISRKEQKWGVTNSKNGNFGRF